ncbi:hypothetical protein ACCAA_950002 [Candidatus Accumulibacter aalborgensis]|uniref:Uncharacterized protein n=1 Tax=Candidatus Accumulibacter aalborgensis TaxID=1860102 RepID=A0A1A8Y009_9PROT|nr:hypothetical protein ACCAA_950002 [Candidatus Accumulibacter aalborgensis]
MQNDHDTARGSTVGEIDIAGVDFEGMPLTRPAACVAGSLRAPEWAAIDGRGLAVGQAELGAGTGSAVVGDSGGEGHGSRLWPFRLMNRAISAARLLFGDGLVKDWIAALRSQ